MVSRAILNGWPLVPPSRRPHAPLFLIKPTISGAYLPGQTLSVSTAMVLGFPTPTINVQWTRNGFDISGATGTNYAIVEADIGAFITARMTATNSLGTATSIAVGDYVTDLATVLPPAGFVFLTDNDGALLVDNDGSILIEAA